MTDEGDPLVVHPDGTAKYGFKGELLALPADGLRRTVISVPTNQRRPYFFVILLEAYDPVLNVSLWQRQHVCIAGDPVTPINVPTVGGGDFTTAQAGYANNPTLFVTVSLAPAGNIDFQVSNPAAHVNAIDVRITIENLDVGPA